MTGLILVTLSACAAAPVYQPVIPGPSAEVTFVSPFLKDRFISIDRIALYVLAETEDCEFEIAGKIPLSGSESDKKRPVRLQAGKRAYLRLSQNNSEFMGTTSRKNMMFSFVPEESRAYIIKHIDNPSRIRAEFFRVDASGEEKPFDVDGVDVCLSDSR